MCKKCSIQHKMYAREWNVQKVLYTAQNVRSRVGCAKSVLYSTKCMLDSRMCKKCSIQHKMYTIEWDVQKVLYTAQTVHMVHSPACPASQTTISLCTHTAVLALVCGHSLLVTTIVLPSPSHQELEQMLSFLLGCPLVERRGALLQGLSWIWIKK